ncbi:medium-chain acyl-[acyl-carrier-protein] hydrolase [Andreprevotia lacus DSM 23236]|jgi:medium-chain acyl-[acyl-carrier-protein] hydrolase|uniref:Medium-chain acyl-[acyl-carrier-protein] hydrolase n=1 Tax=Andreprevotia lacus DSM 23236 TaxID=1121001 RepID=A0A1W1XEL4_9NEIS|nr:alpha/beta fold hydrolase [Andreprevotia lacus]SMC22376.1 medium-chain acyl-[acyl-carrier-protein] hydrolase [Andreprevotia lacus DSM 23236]
MKSTPPSASPWFAGPKNPAGLLRLYCFPYAGGSANHFLGWQSTLAPFIDIHAVQLPGRGVRFSEPPHSHWKILLDELTNAFCTHLAQQEGPYAFYGHSLGALIAFELTRRLTALQQPLPRQLAVSGCEPPAHRSPREILSTLDDDALIAGLQRLNGTPAEVLAHRELMALLLPAIRADFSLAENYRYQPAPALSMPIAVLTGTSDPRVNADQVDRWQEETQVACTVHRFDGDHFFIDSQQRAVLALLHKCLTVEN